jgi:hypothetical protein
VDALPILGAVVIPQIRAKGDVRSLAPQFHRPPARRHELADTGLGIVSD